MNDKLILEMINKAVQPPAENGFDDVRERIAKQSEHEREESCSETLKMIENKEHAGRSFSQIAAFAAAAVITLGLGAALISIGIGTAAGDMAMSESMPMSEEAAEESIVADAEIFAESDISDELASEQDSENAENSEEAYNFTGTEETHTVTTVTGAISGSDIADAMLDEHYIDVLGLSVSLPADAYVTGRNVASDFELLDVYDMSAAQLEANYKTRGIYYNAMWYDDAADVTEIVVTMKEDDISKDIFNLKKADDEQLAAIEKLYHNYEVNIDAVVGAKYEDVSVIEHEQALFFRAQGFVNNRTGRSNHLQYMTIMNGCRIEITLIEHFGIDSELTGEEPTAISDEHSAIMKKVIDSVRWDKVRSDFFHRNRGTIFYTAIVVIGTAAIIFVLLLPENRKKPEKKIKEADESDKPFIVQEPTEDAETEPKSKKYADGDEEALEKELDESEITTDNIVNSQETDNESCCDKTDDSETSEDKTE